MTLHAGDLLYLPRGVVHQAICTEAAFSTHLTLSTYQRHAWTDLLSTLLPRLLEDATNASLPLRRGLPLGFLSEAGSGAASTPRAAELAAQTADMLRRLADHLSPRHVHEAVDEIGADFMRNRLPPPPAAASAGGGGGSSEAPVRSDVLVRLCAPQYRRLVLGGERGEGGEYVQLMHCLQVRRPGCCAALAGADALPPPSPLLLLHA